MAKIQVMKSGQVFVCVPKKLASALDFKKGDSIRFVINGKGRLELVKE